MDDFLAAFGSSLRTMPESEIRNHADALSKKMWEPHKRLSQEASEHFSKIRRFAPEVYWNVTVSPSPSSTPPSLLRKVPWSSSDTLATSVKSCTRSDLIECFARVIGGGGSKRVTAFVYGSKFPLPSGKDSPAVVRARRR